MSQPPKSQAVSIGSAAIYRIVVQGFLDKDYADYLAGMSISQGVQGQTVLIGQVKDQSALSGVLNALLDLHLPLVLVEFLGTPESTQG